MKLLLADDHPLFMQGLKYMLEMHGINVAGTAGNGAEAIEKARAIQPDIILMDIKMPVCSGINALKLIKAEMPEIKIIMLTTSDEDDDLFEAIRLGASGYLIKNINAEELIAMLNNLENDGMPLSPGLAARLLKHFKNDENNELDNAENKDMRAQKLTDRQLEILEMVANGVTYKQVGEKLGLTERTVKYHMNRILDLLNVDNRAEAIAYAARTGIAQNKQ